MYETATWQVQYQVYLKKDAQSLISDTQKKNLWDFLERNVDDCLVTNYNIIDFLENKSRTALVVTSMSRKRST